jgi:addiction module RelE/StbE family toxin
MTVTIKLHKNFIKQAAKLKPAQKTRLHQALTLFQQQPNHPELHNHPLTGKWKDYRSISFGGDWRAHYELTDNGAVAWFVAVGTHAQLYK